MNFSKKRLIAIICCIFFIHCAVRCEVYAINHEHHIEKEDAQLFNKKTVAEGDVLSLQDCVSAAFYNSPMIKKYKYQLDIAKSNVGIAKSEYFPVLGVGVGFYNENNSNNIDYISHSRDFPTVALTLNKLVYNFGKTTAYIKMEKFYEIGAEYEFMDSLCRTLFDVKAKYYAVLKAQSDLKIAENYLQLMERYYKYTLQLKESADIYEADLTNAKIKLNDAKLSVINAQNILKNANIDLNNSMFLERDVDYQILQTKTFNYNNEYITHEPISIYKSALLPFKQEDAVRIACENSPDLRVLEATERAMKESLNFVKRTYLPDLGVNAGYGYNNANHLHTNNSFQVGVGLNSSVNLMNLRHSIKGADAQLKEAQNEIVYYKKNLFYRVKKSLNDLDKYERQIPIAQINAENSYEHLNTVLRGYKSGNLNYTSMQNAIDRYSDSMSEYIESIYKYNLALIEVEEAMHCHIIDIHHKTEHAVHHHEGELIEFISSWMNCDETENHKSHIIKKHKENL